MRGDAMAEPGSEHLDEHGSLVVTIDGPAGSGKSSVARSLAERMGLSVLDTGAMYRAASLATLRHGLDPADGRAVADLLAKLGIEVDLDRSPPVVLLDGKAVGDELRSTEVESIVSTVAAQPEIRRALANAQRAVAQAHPRIVTEGRDQGSVVFPDADVRFYVTASAETRARRRQEQLEAEGRHEDPALVLQRIIQRDKLDRSRPDSPLVKPEGAIEVLTDDLSFEQVVDRLESEVRRVLELPAEGSSS